LESRTQNLELLEILLEIPELEILLEIPLEKSEPLRELPEAPEWSPDFEAPE
jgi:hypothetical protein